MPEVAPVMRMVLGHALSFELVENPLARGRPLVDPRVRIGRRRHRRCEPRLGHHVQPPDFGRMLGDRRVVNRKIVDEHRGRGAVPVDDLPHGTPLAALVADDLVTDAVAGELLDPPAVRLVAEVGEDDDVGDLADPLQRLERARNQGLAVHLAAEEPFEQRPDVVDRHGFPGAAVGQRLGELAAFEVEMDLMLLVEPVGEVRDHVQQHFVAVGDQQRPAHGSSSRRAATNASGLTPISSAMATRSGSCASRNTSSATSKAGSSARCLNSGGSMPLRDRKRAPSR